MVDLYHTETLRHLWRHKTKALMALGLSLAPFLTGPAQADTPIYSSQSPARISIELNRITPLDAGCRLSFVAHNKTGAEVKKLVLETVLFDTSGGVTALSLFDFQTLPNGKPRVRQFDLADTDCAQLGQVLINGVATCDGSAPLDCQNALSLSSRTEQELSG